MADPIAKSVLLTDLQGRIQQHCQSVDELFYRLDHDTLMWQPKPKEWNILQCFDHLNLTHDYYTPRITEALSRPQPAAAGHDDYTPSFWGRIYMYFAFNPQYSFPTAAVITPAAVVSREVFSLYRLKQMALLQVLEQVEAIDIRQTPVAIEKGIRFNLGDCLKILVYHDDLHINQARRVLTEWERVRTLD